MHLPLRAIEVKAKGSDRGAHAVLGPRVVQVLIVGPASGVHEEVGDCRDLQSELIGDGRLHLLVRTPCLLEDGKQRTPLDVREDETRLLVRDTGVGTRQVVLTQLTRYNDNHRCR